MITAATRPRVVVAAGLAGAAVWPLLPVHPPLVCPLRAATGIPCPLCGMTRACVAAAHGDLLRSLAFNPAGVLVILAAVTVLVRPGLVARILHPPVPVLTVALGLDRKSTRLNSSH